jgi:hypothetical protein
MKKTAKKAPAKKATTATKLSSQGLLSPDANKNDMRIAKIGSAPKGKSRLLPHVGKKTK